MFKRIIKKRNSNFEIISHIIFVAGGVSIIFLLLITAYKSFLSTPTNIELQTRIRRWIIDTPNLYKSTIWGFNVSYIVVLVLYTYWSTKRFLNKRHLDSILAKIDYFAQGHYSERIPVSEKDKYHVVAQNINNLLDSIEDSFREKKELEKSKDELITNVGHDLRTPLTSIVGYLDLLKNKDSLSPQEYDKYLDIVLRKTGRMQELVNDFFEYSRSQQTLISLNQVDIPLEAFMEQVVADFRWEAEAKGIDLTVEVEPHDIQAYFDPDKFARIFANLITNAFKYGHGATVIHLIAREISNSNYKTLAGRPNNIPLLKAKYSGSKWLVFEVRNNGTLIAEDELEMIFERAYRADQSRTNDIPGSGLGLSIVRNFVHAHGGQTYALIDQDQMVFRIVIPQTI
ncbi:sensor histidine kinase [Eremococcus coleocola]|uniref:sensor histidine kinase n=1 Tax=Eremococcus coleocola TaxID=88132 RepID=UPI0003FF6356|nr:HAMP domain-containing sensor histidine kinase [Eremococcus coleocola]